MTAESVTRRLPSETISSFSLTQSSLSFPSGSSSSVSQPRHVYRARASAWRRTDESDESFQHKQLQHLDPWQVARRNHKPEEFDANQQIFARLQPSLRQRKRTHVDHRENYE